MRLAQYLTPAEVAARLKISRRRVVELARPRDGRPGAFGDGVVFLPFRETGERPARPVRGGKGGVPPPVKLGEWRIPEAGVVAWLERGRAFFSISSGRPDGAA